MSRLLTGIILLVAADSVSTRLEPGIFLANVTMANRSSQLLHFQRSAYKSSVVSAEIICSSRSSTRDPPPSIRIDAVLRSTQCGNEFYDKIRPGNNPLASDNQALLIYQFYFDVQADNSNSRGQGGGVYVRRTFNYACDGHAHFLPVLASTGRGEGNASMPQVRTRRRPQSKDQPRTSTQRMSRDSFVLFEMPADAIYLLVLKVTPPEPNDGASVTLDVGFTVQWKLGTDYLGPMDRPLLPFFGFMCGTYVFFAILWLTWCFWRWRDVLRIQFWIGGVIAIGLVEKMVFFLEYQKMDSTGTEAEGAVEFAEILSCAKKSLSTILVVIVSVGYGVVKPRLGSTLQKVVGLGLIYFLLCSIEGVVRVSKAQHESVKQKQIVVLPLLLLQLGLFYWIFTSLVNTTRALRLRRNEVKLSLYRHFTHTLIFCVLSSVCYMIWSLLTHHLSYCLKDWKELWVDIAFWHVLFSVLLLVIMVLWRPTINNQRYAFTPLLDNAEDDDEEDTVFSEAFTSSEAIKLRTSVVNQQNSNKLENGRKQKDKEVNGLDEDLKWIEQHIPSSLADRALPTFVDSDEEREQVKFEVSKMQ